MEICVTGSSSKLLSKEIATQLRGRTLTYLIFPYSFKKFLRARGVTLERHFEYTHLRYQVKKLLQEYILFGGFPEIAERDEPLKTKILQVLRPDISQGSGRAIQDKELWHGARDDALSCEQLLVIFFNE